MAAWNKINLSVHAVIVYIHLNNGVIPAFGSLQYYSTLGCALADGSAAVRRCIPVLEVLPLLIVLLSLLVLLLFQVAVAEGLAAGKGFISAGQTYYITDADLVSSDLMT